MSHTPLNRQLHHGNGVIFSFGQEQYKPLQSSLISQSDKDTCDSKFEFILKMIEKYESKQILKKVAPIIDSVKIIQQIQQHPDLNKSHSYGSTNCQKYNFSASQETKDEQSILSKVKSELQQSHQKLLNKYLTPIRKLDHSNQDTPQQDVIVFKNNICEFLNQSIEQENQSQNINQETIPMVESLTMTDCQMQITGNQTGIQKQSVRYASNSELFKKNELNEDLKVSHVLVLCIIILIFLVLKI